VLDAIKGWLPQHAGLLPKWMLFLSVVSIGNSVQCYRTLKLTRQIYNADPNTPAPAVTTLSSRTFGTWTFITSVVRFYAAYNIDNPAMYKVAFATYLVAFGHFTSEWLLFKSARWNPSLASPLAVSTATLVWMLRQWRWYL